MKAPAVKEPGKIITFYSYKGGSGRSMALANVAWILASNGYRVLAVDWDLEAPGLHRYFAPFMLDPELTDSEGVIDIVNNYVTAAMTPPDDAPTPLQSETIAIASKWYEPFANILRYATSLDWNFPEHQGRKGWVDLIPAGRQGPSYATRMNSFSWQNFYDRLGGGGFIETVKQRMKEEYDYISIDSRTGVSDTSGICTVQLPDILAACFTLNRQSIEGASAVAGSVDAQRRDGAGESTLRIFPIPTRVEKAEKDKLDLAREAAKEEFAPFMRQLDQAEQDQYWGHVEVFYEPFYAYEEILATFGDKPFQASSLLASMERITAWLTDHQATQLAPVDESERRRVLAKYARHGRKTKAAKGTAPTSSKDYVFYFSYARSDLDEYLERFFDDLSREVRVISGALASESVGFVDLDIAAGIDWGTHLAESLFHSRVLVPIYSPAFFNSETTGKEFQHFLDREASTDERQIGILPVIWVASTTPLPTAAAMIQQRIGTLPDAYNKFGLHSLMRLRRYEDEYREFVSQFAHYLVDLAERAPIAERPISSFNDLPNAFSQPISARAQAAIRPTRVTQPSGVELVLVPGGTFLMGSPASDAQGPKDERPAHEVQVPSFYLGRHPVTNEEYGQFLKANPDVEDPSYWGDRQFNQATQPVVGVSWEDAQRFAEWAGGRLPTEAEWEYAARAGTTTRYWWGDELGKNNANCDGCGSQWDGKQTAPVGSFQPNAFGLHDMLGNVWEWVEDCWHESYKGAPTDGSVWGEQQGGGCARRVNRGGSWGNGPRFVRSAARIGFTPGSRGSLIGFRLAQDL